MKSRFLMLMMLMPMLALAYTEVVDGISWTYTVCNGEAIVWSGDYSSTPAVSESTIGAIAIPQTLNNCPVTGIGDYAFYNCRGLTSVTIPEGVTSIGYYAFESCSGLTSIAIPSSVRSVGYSAFANCSGLTSVKIPDGVTSIEGQVFWGCSRLSAVTIPLSVTSIDQWAFSDLNHLEIIFVPDEPQECVREYFGNQIRYQKIGVPINYEWSCRTCGNGEVEITGVRPAFGDVIIPLSIEGARVTGVGDFAFSECSGLSSVAMPESVTSVGRSAFSGCSGLTALTLPKSVTSIGNFAFSYCSGLKSVTMQSNVTNIGIAAFSDCCELKAVTLPNGVSSVDAMAFENCSSLKSVTLPSNLTSIGSSAFYGCSGLESVMMPSGVTNICDFAFYGCSKLKSLTVPPSVASIGSSAFRECSRLSSLTLSEGVESIGAFAFCDCSSLASVTIPSSITRIGHSAFMDCCDLTSVNLPKDLTCIENSVFSGCRGLMSVSVPSGVKRIEYAAFRNCSGLTSLNLPEDLQEVDDFAFSDCSRLTSVVMPSIKLSISKSAFSSCRKIRAVAVPSCAAKLSDIFPAAYGMITDVMLTEGGAKLTDGMFANCSKITSVVIPACVTNIGDKTFFGCAGLTAITIPQSVTSIADGAFEGCGSLEVVFVEAEPQECVKRCFGDQVWYQNVDTPINYEWKYALEDGNAIITGVRPAFGDAVVPSSCEGFPVTGIGDSAFSDYSGLTSITIPESVVSFGYSVFDGCTNLNVNLLCACPEGYESSGITSVRSVDMPWEYLETYPHAQEEFAYSYVMSSCALIIDGVGGRTYTQFVGEMEPSRSLSEYSRLAIGCNDEIRFLEPDEYSITEHSGWKYIVARVEGEYADCWHLVIGNPAFRGYAGGTNDEWFYQYWNRGALASRYNCRRGDVIAITPEDGDWPWIEYSELGYQMGEYADFLDGVYYLYLPRVEVDSEYYPEYKYGRYSGLKVTINSSVEFYAGPEYDPYDVTFDLGFQGGNVTIHARQSEEVQDPWYGEWVDIKPYYDESLTDENDYPYYTRYEAGWRVADGWRFVGWVDEDGEFYDELEDGYWYWWDCASLGFTAQYELIQYKLEYVDEKGAGVPNPHEFNVQDSTNLNAPQNIPGWTFLGWFDESDEHITNTSQLTAQNHTLTAKWARVYNKVLFEIEGHGEFDDDELAAQDVAWGEHARIPGVVPDLGWRFFGWNDDVLQPIYSNSVFVARFEMVTNRITYLDTKSALNANVLNYVVTNEIVFIALSDLPDWHFDGWSPASIPAGSTGDVTVQALWRQIETAEIVGAWSEPQTFEYDGKVHGVDYSARLDVMEWPLNVVTQGTIRAVNVGEYAATATAETVGVPETDSVYYRCAAVTNECKWTITPKPVTKLQIDYVSTAMIADGQQQRPQIVVRDVERGVVLTSADYAVDYENNVEPGMGVARITGKGNYGGVTTIEFPIVAGVSPAEGLNMDGGTFEIVGETDWVADNVVTHDRYASMRSGAIGDNEESTLAAVVHGAGTVSFWWKVSSQHFDSVLELDRLEFYVDGVRQKWMNGDVDWTKLSFKVNGAGPHELKWVYAKDGSISEREDCGWVDEVSWEKEWLIGDWLNDVDREFATSNVKWTSDAAVSSDGVGSMRSGACQQGQRSVLSTVVENVGTLTFKWKCSCVAYGEYVTDKLSLLVDGVAVKDADGKDIFINGETGWYDVSYRITGAGRHEVQWVFEKISDRSMGQDCGWVDVVRWDNEPGTLTDEDLVVEAFDGVYDGQGHGAAVSVKGVQGASVKYGASREVIGDATSPTFVNCGEHEVWFAVNVPDFNEYVGKTVVRVSPRSIETGETTLGESLVYTGSVLTQAVASVVVGGLAATFEVSDNTACAAGAYQLTVIGTGNFCGELSVPFSVAKAQTPSGDVTVEGYSPEAGAVEFTYDGKAHMPTVVAGYDGAAVVRFALTEEGPYADELNVSNVVERMDVWYEIVSANYERLVGQTRMTIRPLSIAGAEVVLGEQVSDAEGHVVQLVDSVIVNGLSVTFVVSNNVAEAEGDFELSVYGVGNFEGEAKCPYSVGGIVLPPVLTPGDGTIFTESLVVRFSAQTPDSKWYYTIDGSMPTTNSLKAARVNLHGKTTIRAIAVLDGKLRSAVVEAHYALGACENPTIRLDGRDGCVFNFPEQLVVIDRSGDEGVVRYTLDGSEPTADSPAYEGPFAISVSTTVRAKTFSDSWFDSETVTANMRLETLSVPSPVIDVVSEYCGTKTTVSLSCALPGAVIRYTLDGSEPTVASALYEQPFEIGGEVGSAIRVRVRAFCEHYADSSVAEAVVTRVWGIGDILGVPDMTFETDGWVVDAEETFAGCESMRSGPTDDGETNTLETVVHGGGVVAFSWRTSCEDSSGDFIWDRAEFWVDEECVAKVEGESEWTHVSYAIQHSDDDHHLRWIYVKDPDVGTAEGDDCAWLAALTWESETTKVPSPTVEGDEGATVTGDAETGFVVKPSEGNTAVEVSIPDGIDADLVTVEVSSKVASVKPHGAKVKVVSGGADITEFLNVPVADGNGVVDLTKAKVKEEYVKEALDPAKGAKIELCNGSQGTASPTITTAPTRVGLFYQLREGETLEGMKGGDSKVGDGEPWTPEIKVKGGSAAFYSIGVGKGE